MISNDTSFALSVSSTPSQSDSLDSVDNHSIMTNARKKGIDIRDIKVIDGL